MDRKNVVSALVFLWGVLTVFGAFSQGLKGFRVYLPGLALIFLGLWLYSNPDSGMWGDII